jgi:hypothetical protein
MKELYESFLTSIYFGFFMIIFSLIWIKDLKKTGMIMTHIHSILKECYMQFLH